MNVYPHVKMKRFIWNVIDTNLFRPGRKLGTDQGPPPKINKFIHLFFVQIFFQCLTKKKCPKNIESVQIYMKDAECGVTNEKSIFIFRVMVIFVPKIWSIFDEFSPITRKIKIVNKSYFAFHSIQHLLLIFRKNLTTSERGGVGSAYP